MALQTARTLRPLTPERRAKKRPRDFCRSREANTHTHTHTHIRANRNAAAFFPGARRRIFSPSATVSTSCASSIIRPSCRGAPRSAPALRTASSAATRFSPGTFNHTPSAATAPAPTRSAAGPRYAARARSAETQKFLIKPRRCAVLREAKWVLVEGRKGS